MIIKRWIIKITIHSVSGVVQMRWLMRRLFIFGILMVIESIGIVAVQCAAQLPTQIQQLDRAISGARFLTGGVLKCDIANRRSVAVLCMLYIGSGVTRCTI